MREALLGKLALVLSRATPGELAAIYRFATGEAFPELREAVPGSEPKQFSAGQTSPLCTSAAPPPKAEIAVPLRYSLCRKPACWVLCFNGNYAYLKHEIGLDYVSYLLRHPNEAVAGAALFSKFHRQSAEASGITALLLPDTGELVELSDDATLSEESLDKDTESVLAVHRAKAQECRETLHDPDASPSDKKFAGEQLRQIIAFLRSEKRTARDPNARAARRVRRSIQRLCDNLAPEEPGATAPDPVAREFAAYIAQHILGPIRRYTVPKKGANVRVARGELAGQLLFECPPGHCWSVRP
jgi:hypothetical protein